MDAEYNYLTKMIEKPLIRIDQMESYLVVPIAQAISTLIKTLSFGCYTIKFFCN